MLGVEFIISGDTTKVVSYKLKLDKYECDGYCPNSSSILCNNEAKKYRGHGMKIKMTKN